MRQSCSGAPVKAGSATSSRSAVAASARSVPAIGDLEVWRSGIAAGVGDRRDGPLLLSLHHVGRQAQIDRTGRPRSRILARRPGAGIACGGESAVAPRRRVRHGRANPPTGDALDRQFERRAGARGFNAVGARPEVVAGDGPAVAPEQRTDIEHADATAIEIRLVVAARTSARRRRDRGGRNVRDRCSGRAIRETTCRRPASMSMPMLSRNGPVTLLARGPCGCCRSSSRRRSRSRA